MQKRLSTRVYDDLSIEQFYKVALGLLSQGIPFICTSRVTYDSGVSGDHAFVILGYKYSSSLEQKIKFLIRDSNRKENRWVTGRCGEIVAVG